MESEISRHPEGVSIDDLHAGLADLVSRRTLQRCLASLIGQKRIQAEGEGCAVHYMPMPALAKEAASAQVSLSWLLLAGGAG